jgi:hypothetical protein
MSGDEDNERTVREVEETVLDQESRRFGLIYRNDDVAIPRLLTAFGDLVRRMIHDPNLGTDTQRQNLMDGKAAALGHCFKWIAQEPEHTLLLADNRPEVITQEAIDLLEWGAAYHELFLDHVALSKGEKVAEADCESRTIKIRFRNRFIPFFYLAQQADEIAFTTSYFSAMPLEELKAEFRSWSVRRRNALQRRADGLPSVRPGDSAHEAATRWATETIWPELGPETSLDGFSLGDFRRVFAGLVVNCSFLAWLEDVEDSAKGAVHTRPSRLVEFPHEGMVEWLAEIGGVSAASAREILGELTLDTSRLLPSIAYQAFIMSKAGRVYLLPRSILYSDAARTLSQSLNTGGRQRVFESLGGRIADAQLKRIADAFAELGLDVVCDRPLRYGGREIRPDLIVYDRAREYLLVADYKSMINPIGPRQSISNMKNIQDYVAKVWEYERLVMSDLSVLRVRIPALSETPKGSGLLLFRDPTPLPLEPDPSVAMANWFSLGRFLSGGYDDLPGVVAWATARPDLDIRPGSYGLEGFGVPVGDWSYVSEKIIRDLT